MSKLDSTIVVIIADTFDSEEEILSPSVNWPSFL